MTTLLLAALLSAACTAKATSAPPASGSPGGGSLLPKSPTELPTFDPARFKELLAQLRGKPVVVNIWASWCGPCRVEAPELAKAARRFAGRAQFVGVDVLDQRGPAQSFIRTYGWPYPSVFDPTGAIRNDLGFVGVPVSVFFDRSGHRAYVWSGPVTAGILDTELAKLVSGTSP